MLRRVVEVPGDGRAAGLAILALPHRETLTLDESDELPARERAEEGEIAHRDSPFHGGETAARQHGFRRSVHVLLTPVN